MQIFIDADACPRSVREVVFRAAEKRSIPVILVANRRLNVPERPWLSQIIVAAEMDAADDRIVDLVQTTDLVITADVPLAFEVVEKGASAISPRGSAYTNTNISNKLTMRDVGSELRSCGVETGGPPPFGVKETEQFANGFNKWLCKALNKRK